MYGLVECGKGIMGMHWQWKNEDWIFRSGVNVGLNSKKPKYILRTKASSISQVLLSIWWRISINIGSNERSWEIAKTYLQVFRGYSWIGISKYPSHHCDALHIKGEGLNWLGN